MPVQPETVASPRDVISDALVLIMAGVRGVGHAVGQVTEAEVWCSDGAFTPAVAELIARARRPTTRQAAELIARAPDLLRVIAGFAAQRGTLFAACDTN
jgi:hypothetical protein